MNTQLSEGIKVWKAGEFARFVQREIDRDHNPDSPANRWQPSTERTAPVAVGVQPKVGTFSWRQFNLFMGVNPTFRHDIALIDRAA